VERSRITVSTRSPEETLRLAVKLGKRCGPGDVISLTGELGSGKTLFAKGLARGLDVPKDEPVVSPSFTLLNEYAGRCPVYHFDFYRLDGVQDLENLGIDEYIGGEGVVMVEWAERIPEALGTERLEIHLEYAGENERTIIISGIGRRYTELVGMMRQESGFNSLNCSDLLLGSND